MFFGCCLGGGGVFMFLLLGRARGRACFFVAVWAGVACLCFYCLGGPGRSVFFCCLGGVCLCFCCLGRGRDYFCCCLGGGREFSHWPVRLARLYGAEQQKRPNSKKKTRVPLLVTAPWFFAYIRYIRLGGVGVQTTAPPSYSSFSVSECHVLSRAGLKLPPQHTVNKHKKLSE